ncbi:nudix hydrolase [Salix suchowensis]|nr:nudix hydrolase [Salix suchowensis]
MPQSGIDENEDPKVAAIRELKEETDVTSAEVLAEAPSWLTYDFPPEKAEHPTLTSPSRSFTFYFLARFISANHILQPRTHMFLLKFTGNEEEINLLGDGSEKPEFGEWPWMSPEQVIDLAVDFKKPVYKEVLAVKFRILGFSCSRWCLDYTLWMRF